MCLMGFWPDGRVGWELDPVDALGWPFCPPALPPERHGWISQTTSSAMTRTTARKMRRLLIARCLA